MIPEDSAKNVGNLAAIVLYIACHSSSETKPAERWAFESNVKLQVVFSASDNHVIGESTLEEIVPAFPLLPLCKQRSREQ